MPDIAIGRKEILDVLHISSWRTVQKWKKRDPGFAKLIRHHPVTGTPFVVKAEIKIWMIRCDELKKEAIIS